MTDEYLAILADSKLFSGFSPEQLEEVIRNLNPKSITLEDHQQVYKKGDIADRCWLIQSGKLVFKRSSLRSPFMTLSKGSVTGILGLVEPGAEHDITMTTDGKVKLIEITHEGITGLSTETQSLLWHNVSKQLMRKLRLCLSQETLDHPA